jgi:hypothetical protein
MKKISCVSCAVFKLALIGGCLAGCYEPRQLVSVDTSKVIFEPVKTEKLGGTARTTKNLEIGKRSLPSLPSATVLTDRRVVQDNLRKSLEQESNQAIEVIKTRLVEFYQKEIDEFYTKEVDRISVIRGDLSERFKAQTRVIFDKFALLRAPLVTRFAFLADFPLPKQLIPIEGEGIDAKESKKRLEMRELKRKLDALDLEYDKEISEIEESLNTELGAQAGQLSDKLDAKQDEINQRALQEASRQVRRFGETISARLFGDTEQKLPAVPGTSVSAQKSGKATAANQAPVVTFTNQSSVSGKAILENELQTWLSLNRYQLAEPGVGVQDVTDEFLKWRISLKTRSNIGLANSPKK